MSSFRAWTFWLILISVLVTGCRSQPPVQTSAPLSSTPVGTQVPATTLTASPAPSPSPSPTSPPGLVLLMMPAGGDTEFGSRLLEALQSPLAQLGLSLESSQDLPAGDLAGSGIRLVIALPGATSQSDPAIASAAAANPQVQFLAVGIPGLQPAANLSLIGPQGLRPDRQGFIAGVIAAMVTPDWRVASLGPGDSEAALDARQGFLNGAVYFCGLCLPYHGPTNIDYPIYWDLPAAASPEAIQAALQGLKDLAVTTLYLSPGTYTPAMSAPLAESGMHIIGSGAPPPELADSWVVSVQVDPLPSILDLLPALLQGQGGHSLDLEISLQNANEALFSQGRQMRASEILADLLSGLVDPGLDLLQP